MPALIWLLLPLIAACSTPATIPPPLVDTAIVTWKQVENPEQTCMNHGLPAGARACVVVSRKHGLKCKIITGQMTELLEPHMMEEIAHEFIHCFHPEMRDK
jgi:hypothetical protein